MRIVWTNLLALAVMVALPASRAQAGGIGGTFQLEVGGGGVYHKHAGGTSETYGVAAKPVVGAGIKFDRQVGVIFQISGLSNDKKGDVLAYTAAVQYWPIPRLFLGAGIAVSDYRFAKPMIIDGENAKGWRGLGFSARVGYSVLGTRGHRLTIGFLVAPAFYPDDKTLGFALVGGYQYW